MWLKQDFSALIECRSVLQENMVKGPSQWCYWALNFFHCCVALPLLESAAMLHSLQVSHALNSVWLAFVLCCFVFCLFVFEAHVFRLLNFLF